MSKMYPVVHFEMPSYDMKRMTDFYAQAFGWESRDLGADMGGYNLVTTAETDEAGVPQERARINGGFFSHHEGAALTHPSLVIGVDDIHAAIERVRTAGGTIMGEPMEIPGFGMYISFVDTEGNKSSIMQPLMAE